jgi:hypothetical protein
MDVGHKIRDRWGQFSDEPIDPIDKWSWIHSIDSVIHGSQRAATSNFRGRRYTCKQAGWYLETWSGAQVACVGAQTAAALSLRPTQEWWLYCGKDP